VAGRALTRASGLVLVGAAAGFVSLFLRWDADQRVFSWGSFSSFAMARSGIYGLLAFPDRHGLPCIFSGLNLKGDRAPGPGGCRLHLMIGTGWALVICWWRSGADLEPCVWRVSGHGCDRLHRRRSVAAEYGDCGRRLRLPKNDPCKLCCEMRMVLSYR